MAVRIILRIGVAILVTMTIPVQAGHGGSGHGGSSPGGGVHHTFNGNAGGFFPGFGVGGGGFFYYSPILVIAPGGFMPPMPAMMPPFMPRRGPLLAPPPPGMLGPDPRANVRPANVRHGDPVRAAQLITVGDRLFRAGNLKKAEERYQQAMRTAPDLAAPPRPPRPGRPGSGQLHRGRQPAPRCRDRRAGLDRHRPRHPVDLRRAGRVQPARSPASNPIVQIHPDDRDAWLVLGAEWFLSGRTAKAADVFLRLNDPNRKPDVALAAFLDACNQAEPSANGSGPIQ